jgi:hypothetical protein
VPWDLCDYGSFVETLPFEQISTRGAAVRDADPWTRRPTPPERVTVVDTADPPYTPPRRRFAPPRRWTMGYYALSRIARGSSSHDLGRWATARGARVRGGTGRRRDATRECIIPVAEVELVTGPFALGLPCRERVRLDRNAEWRETCTRFRFQKARGHRAGRELAAWLASGGDARYAKNLLLLLSGSTSWGDRDLC